MKDIRSLLSQTVKHLLVFSAIVLFFNTLAVAADPEHYSEETLITLDFEDKSLNQVLKEISWITGYSFIINKEYADLKISGSLKKVPLHQGLKEIVGKRSHTITYEPNNTVFLTLYKSSPPPLFAQSVTDLSHQLNYTIRPDNMNRIPTEADLETSGTEIEQSQGGDYQEDYQMEEDAFQGDADAAEESTYIQDDEAYDQNDDVYDDDSAFDYDKPLVSQKRDGRLRGTNLQDDDFDDSIDNATRDNDTQDDYGYEEIENTAQQYEEVEY